ncbi:class 1 fructose-bisphosphatase [Methylophilus medardicus]|uniref:Fructose-1,6-bisphosphatase class 1 n=1 Tax=Methylophilus medardicus TaxID=2588534 RepID=A0A5B8CUY0_9PROT|nr:class 1 fructose-bisphosphatase [Methylophilus medardicus]QDC44715.1 class 1 fructose-bisphosphatase [Methylophilus medardicus]QDC49722.1 class 1 fructose-bisphosphatase [Methylophilus medardicus]QDC53427.1 class 1 fructose-bisphosphatase [Methylophilus medardicus]
MQLDVFLKQVSINQALNSLISHIAEAGIEIASLVKQGALAGVTEKMTTTNVQGETQMQLDILSHDLALAQLRASTVVAGVLSEEVDAPVLFETLDAPFLVSMDPLDGSSNLAINGVVGSIFSILPNTGVSRLGEQAFLQPGQAQRAAAYVMYGPATLLVLTMGQGTHVFTLDAQQQIFTLTQQTVQIADQTTEFAINTSNQRYWQPAMQRYIAECLHGADGPRGHDFNMRWCASMVMDVHRILTRGGVFLYPRDTKQPVKAGRLRLLYEANPMSLLVTQAGGASIDGLDDILSIQPTSCHQRVPVLLGAKQEIQRLRDYHQQASH